MKLSDIAVLLVAVLFLEISVFAATDAEKESISDTARRIEALKQSLRAQRNVEKETIDRIFAKSDEIEGAIRRLDESERSLGGIGGLGNVEQMRIKADRYALERQYRLKLQEQARALHQRLQEWRAMEKKIRETEEIIDLHEQIMKLERTVEAESPIGTMSEQDFEYYRVEREATLQEISALPDVYGDANLWKYIFEANRATLKRADAKIPEGTLLIIPNTPANVASGTLGGIEGLDDDNAPSGTEPASISKPAQGAERTTGREIEEVLPPEEEAPAESQPEEAVETTVNDALPTADGRADPNEGGAP
jgi:hypothetical protein